MPSAKDAYEKKTDAQMKEIQAKIAMLKAQADQASADVQIQYHRQIDEFERRFEQTKENLNELSQSTQDSWRDLKSDVTTAVENLSENVNSLVEQITS